MLPLKNKSFFIISGTGSLGKVLTKRLLSGSTPYWDLPAEYLAPDVSSTVVRIVSGYLHGSAK